MNGELEDNPFYVPEDYEVQDKYGLKSSLILKLILDTDSEDEGTGETK